VAFGVAFIIMTVVFDGVISDSVAAAATLPLVWLFSNNSGSKSVNGYSGIVKYALLGCKKGTIAMLALHH